MKPARDMINSRVIKIIITNPVIFIHLGFTGSFMELET
jgi:hypothetical protein